MSIILFKGRRGTGKTLTMVYEALKYHLEGYTVLSNLSLTFGKYISSQEVLSLNRDSKLFNCVLALDEVQLFFDSRNFSKQENKDFSNFIQQIRKRNIIILFTTQYVNTVDLRLRQHIDYVACPVFDKKTGFCYVRYFDLTAMEDFDSQTIPSSIVIYDAKPIYPLYNTYEMLK